ncbi:MAG: hypothetical protein LBF66_03380 [Holosporales bacterium]|jgi:hypothetical protein|nr:hypothetical protein [Holosporales bacterium]
MTQPRKQTPVKSVAHRSAAGTTGVGGSYCVLRFLGNIHIPSDVPGFLRAQSLVTSGLVPRSVSREPYTPAVFSTTLSSDEAGFVDAFVAKAGGNVN